MRCYCFLLLGVFVSQAGCRGKNNAVDIARGIYANMRHPSTLDGHKQTLELTYISWACECANWITIADADKYKDEHEAHCIFIEPAADSLAVPECFDRFRHHIRVTGEFYTKPGYPEGITLTEDMAAIARVFRYTKIEVVPD